MKAKELQTGDVIHYNGRNYYIYCITHIKPARRHIYMIQHGQAVPNILTLDKNANDELDIETMYNESINRPRRQMYIHVAKL
jgi:hypothetical protein